MRVWCVWLLQASLAAHQGGHFLNAFQGEGRLTQGLHGDAHELHGIVVRRHAVGAQRAAALAAVYDGPLAAPAHPDRYRLHNAAAVALPVARLYVNMQAGQAVGAVVAMAAARVLRGAQPAADLAGERVIACVSFIVTIFKCFAFVFAVNCLSS